jgi:iron complex transport system permease protein
MRTLTRRRLVLTLALSLTACVLMVLVAPLVGVGIDDQGRRFLQVLDLGRALGGDPTDAHAGQFWLRVPRVLAGAIAGAGLATAGASFQAVLRNPLAEPFTLGVSQGATLGAVVGIHLGLQPLLGGSAVALFAFLGAMLAMLTVWRLARVGRSLPAGSLLLAGICLGVTCAAVTMLVQSTAGHRDSYVIVSWMMGGLGEALPHQIVPVAVAVGLGLTILIAHARDLTARAAGGDAAASVGVSVERTTLVCHGAASLIVGAVIAVAGPVGFVGLIVPHALRGLVGPDHRVLLPASVLVGAAFVVLCDTVGRTVLAPDHVLPVGVITALLGGSFFLWLLRREKNHGQLWG